MKAQKKAEDFLQLNLQKVKLENDLKEINKRISQESIELFEAMEDEEVDSLEIKGVKFEPDVKQTFTLDGKLKGKKWDCDEFFKWLKSKRLGGVIKVKKSVPWNTREKLIKEYIEKGGQLPDFISEKFFNTIKFNSKAVERILDERNEHKKENPKVSQ